MAINPINIHEDIGTGDLDTSSLPPTDMGPEYLTPPPLLTSDGHHLRHVQTCSSEDIIPPPFTSTDT